MVEVAALNLMAATAGVAGGLFRVYAPEVEGEVVSTDKVAIR
jgi:hypothetical protein